jgi:hypothetical protein
MPHACAMGVSRSISLAQSARVAGANTSSFSHEPVLLWCLPCVMRHEWYGTSNAEWQMVPTMLFASSLSEKLWWPHSCASTHTPVHTAPCAYQYNGHSTY